MEKLKQKMLEEAYIIDNRIVKVDHFINHMLDTELLFEIGQSFHGYFDEKVTKILTIETSGIAFAVATAYTYGNIPVVFAKKKESLITGNHLYQTNVYSYTKQINSIVTVDKKFLTKEDHVLIIDDFLALGNASLGLVDLVKQSGAHLVGVGAVIEKTFQGGRQKLEEKSIKVRSLANIKNIIDNQIIF